MEFILDTVDLEEIKDGVDHMPIVGVTSNPSIVKKTSPEDFFGHMRKVREIIGKECRGSLRQHQDNCKDGAAGTQQRSPPKTRVCQKFFCQQPDSGQHVRKKAELQARYRCTGNAGRRSSTSCNLLCRRRHPGRYEPGTHPTWDRYGYPAYPYPPIFANHTGSPPFCRRTYPIGRCRYHGSRFGIKKEEYEE